MPPRRKNRYRLNCSQRVTPFHSRDLRWLMREACVGCGGGCGARQTWLRNLRGQCRGRDCRGSSPAARAASSSNGGPVLREVGRGQTVAAFSFRRPPYRQRPAIRVGHPARPTRAGPDSHGQWRQQALRLRWDARRPHFAQDDAGRKNPLSDPFRGMHMRLRGRCRDEGRSGARIRCWRWPATER